MIVAGYGGLTVPGTTTGTQSRGAAHTAGTAFLSKAGQPEEPATTEIQAQTETRAEPSYEDRIADISRRYDTRNISPHGIDKLGQELKDAGYEPFGDVLSLLTHGEAFRSFQNSIPGQGGAASDPNQRTDLVADVALQREMAERWGGATGGVESIEALLDVLEAAKAGRAEASQEPLAVSSSPDTASLLALQSI
jgi:hypothetical protein